MIDFIYAKEVTYDTLGVTFSITGGIINFTYAMSGDNLSYKEMVEEVLSGLSVSPIFANMEGEFLQLLTTSSPICHIVISDIQIATALGFPSDDFFTSGGVYTALTWGDKLPRTTIHSLASIQGGFHPDKKVLEFARQKETKITSNMTYSTPFKVRRGYTYTYRLDGKYIDHFDYLLALWRDKTLTFTNDFGIIEGVCISQESGTQTIVYELEDIQSMTLSIIK